MDMAIETSVTHESDADRLRRIIVEAALAHPSNEIAATDRIWQHAQNDAGLLVELIGGKASKLCTEALQRTLRMARSDYPEHRAMALLTEVRPVAEKWAEDDADRKAELQEQMYRSSRASQAKLHTAINQIIEDHTQARIEEYKKSWLFRFTINGLPIGEVTAADAQDWKDAKDADTAFVGMLVSGISPYDRRFLKDIITPAEADSMWAMTH